MMEIWETERIMEDMKLRVSKVAPVHDRRECSWAATIRGRRQVQDRFWRTLKVDQCIIHANTLSTSCSDSERSSLESLQTNTCCMPQLHSPTSRRSRLTETQWRPRSLPSSLESRPSRDCLLAPAHFYYSPHLNACITAKPHSQMFLGILFWWTLSSGCGEGEKTTQKLSYS